MACEGKLDYQLTVDYTWFYDLLCSLILRCDIIQEFFIYLKMADAITSSKQTKINLHFKI